MLAHTTEQVLPLSGCRCPDWLEVGCRAAAELDIGIQATAVWIGVEVQNGLRRRWKFGRSP